MNSCAKLRIWTGILNLAITSFGFPHAITVISSLDNGTFPWTIFDPFLARTLLGFFFGTVFSPSHPYSSSAKDDSKCLGLNDVFQLMDINCHALTSMRWLAWLRDAQMRLLLGTKAKHFIPYRFINFKKKFLCQMYKLNFKTNTQYHHIWNHFKEKNMNHKPQYMACKSRGKKQEQNTNSN